MRDRTARAEHNLINYFGWGRNSAETMTFLSSDFGFANERLSAARECGIGSCVFGSDACYRQPLHREPGDETFNGGGPSGKGTSAVDGWEDLAGVA